MKKILVLLAVFTILMQTSCSFPIKTTSSENKDETPTQTTAAYTTTYEATTTWYTGTGDSFINQAKQDEKLCFNLNDFENLFNEGLGKMWLGKLQNVEIDEYALRGSYYYNNEEYCIKVSSYDKQKVDYISVSNSNNKGIKGDVVGFLLPVLMFDEYNSKEQLSELGEKLKQAYIDDEKYEENGLRLDFYFASSTGKHDDDHFALNISNAIW